MPSTEDLILQLERKALDRWVESDKAGFCESYGAIYAEDATYFDPLTRARIDGLPALRALCEAASEQKEIARYEIENPHVVDAGELAVLTYNLVDYERDPESGEEKLGDSWNCTSVYRKVGADWKVIHSHWSYTAHPAFREPPVEGEAGA